MNLTASHSLWAFLGIGLTCLAYGAGKWREGREERRNFTRLGKNTGKPEDDPVAAILSDLYRNDALKLEPHRLRYKPMTDLFSYEAAILPAQEKNYPELVKRLRETARRLAADGREITSDDIHAAHPIPDGVDGRVMAAAFHPKREWQAVGWVPSKRKEKNHSRHIRKWRLREAQAA